MLFSILLTCLNEEKRIAAAIESLLDDHFLENGEMLILDGGSTDRTRMFVRSFIDLGWPIRLIDNEGRIQSEGLNIGLRLAQGRFIVRADAHSVYPPRYVERCIELLSKPDVVNAGGMMSPAGDRPVQKAIALAMRHPLGVGDAKYHLGKYQGYYGGVYLGTFKREIFDRVGGYDPAVHPNEDADLNIRIIESGARIWLDGSIQVIYSPRDSFSKLAAQYFQYGRGRARTTLKHKRFTSWRQMLPPLWAASLALSSGALLLTGNILFLGWIGLYLAGVLAVSMSGRVETRPGLRLRFLTFIAFVVMHTAWGFGFWFGAIAPAKTSRQSVR